MAKWLQISFYYLWPNLLNVGFLMGPTFSCLHLCFRQATAGRSLSCQWAGSKLRFFQAYFQWLSFPPANFPFDLKVLGFLLGTSHILAEGLWQLNLDSALNSPPLFSQWVFCQRRAGSEPSPLGLEHCPAAKGPCSEPSPPAGNQPSPGRAFCSVHALCFIQLSHI